MARFETWVNRDLKKVMTAEDIRGTVFTLDNLGNLIGVRVFSDGQPVTLSGSVNGYCILADGTTVPVAGTRSGNEAYIVLPQSAYAVPGMIRIAIKLTDGSAITTLAALIGSVAMSRTDNMITPSSQVITDWSQQIAAEMQAVEDASAAQDVKIGYLKNAFADKTITEYGKINIGTPESGKYVRIPDGATNNSTNWSYTDYIKIERRTLMFTCPEHNNANVLSTVAALAFYKAATYSAGSYLSSESINVISGTPGNYQWIVVNVPAEANYFRASILNSIASEFRVIGIGELDTEYYKKLESVYAFEKVAPVRYPNYLRDKLSYAYGYIKDDGTIMINSTHPKIYAYFTDYIPVSAIESVAFLSDYNNKAIAFAWYGERFAFLSRTNIYPATDGTKQVAEVPSGAMYLRISIMTQTNEEEYTDAFFQAHQYIISDGKNADVPLAFFSVPIIDNEQQYKGRKISILGDSISTYAGENAQSASDSHTIADGTYTYAGNHCRYPNDYLKNVNDTYWKMLINEFGMTLGINDSWAGSCVSWDGTEGSDKGANIYIASPTRIGHLDDNGTPDIILVNAGTNDIGKDVPIGTFNTESPKNYTDAQIAALPVETFADAYRALLIRLQKSYPLARIVVMLPNYTTSYYNPAEADSYLEIIKEACDYFGVPWIDMRTTGINMYNTGTYMGDGVHPNPVGMRMLYEKILKFFQYSL